MARRRGLLRRGSESAEEQATPDTEQVADEATNGDAADPPAGIAPPSTPNGDHEAEPATADAKARPSVGKRVMNWLGYGIQSDEALAGQRPPAVGTRSVPEDRSTTEFEPIAAGGS